MPNPDEVAVVGVSCDTYLATGSLTGTAEELNPRGYRTKAYTPRRELQHEPDNLDREAVDTELVRAALGQITELFEALNPYEQRELMQLVLKGAEVNEREITLEVYA